MQFFNETLLAISGTFHLKVCLFDSIIYQYCHRFIYWWSSQEQMKIYVLADSEIWQNIDGEAWITFQVHGNVFFC